MANVHGCECSRLEDMTRRELLSWSGKGLAVGAMGLSLSQLLSLREASANPFPGPENPFYDGLLTVFYSGGPTHIDTWDVKPGSQNRGPFQSIGLGVNDVYNEEIRISEVFPNLAGQVQNDPAVGMGLIRGFWHGSNNHDNGRTMMGAMWRGALLNMYPSLAPAMAYYFQGQNIGIPSVVINGNVADGANDNRGNTRVPTALQVDDNGNGAGGNPVVEALQLPPGVDLARYRRRKSLLDKLNQRFLDSRPDIMARAQERATEDAFSVTEQGDAAAAFDLTGKTLLPADSAGVSRRLTLAQELLKAGVSYVTCGIGGNDTHSNNMQQVRRNWGNSFDNGVGTMVQNLKATGKRYLIVAYGDFGRTPNTVANGRDGRDHWGDAFSVAMISVNQPKFTTNAIGNTGPDGMFRNRDGNLVDGMEPKDLGGFLYRSMGIPIGAPDGRADIPLNGRAAPPVDRNNESSRLMQTFGLV